MTILKHLFSPIQIGRMTAKNRLLMSAMSINFGVDEKGHVTDQLTGYLAARAKGGAGMIILQMMVREEMEDAIIVVTRWYGGTHLGGDRFRRVQDCVRIYLDAREG